MTLGQMKETLIQYNTVKPNVKGPAVLLGFRDSFGLNIKARLKQNQGTSRFSLV